MSTTPAFKIFDLLRPDEGMRIDPEKVARADSEACPLAFAWDVKVDEGSDVAGRLLTMGRIDAKEVDLYAVDIQSFIDWWDGDRADTRAQCWQRRVQLASELTRRGWL